MSVNEAELLDEFAKIALAKTLERPLHEMMRLVEGKERLGEAVARVCYGYATFMLAERAKRLQPSDLTDLPFGGAK